MDYLNYCEANNIPFIHVGEKYIGSRDDPEVSIQGYVK